MATFLPKILLKEEAANRWQDLARDVINNLTLKILFPIYSTATRPAPSASQSGVIIRMRDPNKPEQLQCCMMTTKGDYGWAVLAQAPS